MAHKAEQILDAVATAVTGLATTAARVKRGRAWPLADAGAALSVQMGEDSAEYEQNVSRINRGLSVYIIAHVKESDDLETSLNSIKTEVYAALSADPQLGGLAIDTRIVEDRAPELEAEQDQPVARMVMHWLVLYSHSSTSTEV